MDAVKRRLVAAASAALAIGIVGATPAHATNEVNFATCIFEGGYFVVGIREPGATLGVRRCFANAGEININQKYVNGFSSGDNAGWFIYNPGDGYEYRHSFAKNEVRNKYYGTIYELHIY